MSRDQKPIFAGTRRPSVDPLAERPEQPMSQFRSREERHETSIVEQPTQRGRPAAADDGSNVVYLFPGRRAGAPRRLGGVRSDVVK